ncbi:MAG: GDSL-type esterase/lipase family protein [Firmicutes bacterium]|nr:GDSL-type esterase/lipase family protein [Bacillota bacterium]
MKRILHSIFCIAVCAVLLVEALPVYAARSSGSFSGNGRSTSTPVVVSMGDSYSAGEGIQDYYGQDDDAKYTNEDWIAHRSTLAWSGLLQFNGKQLNDVKATNLIVGEKLHLTEGKTNGTWYFVASSGAVCDEITGPKQQEKIVDQSWSKNDGTYYLKPQIDTLKALDAEEIDVDYVTLTIGGNDAGFVDVVSKAVLGNFVDLNGGQSINEYIKEVLREFWSESGLGKKLEDTYVKILEAAPNATLIVAGYPQLINYYEEEKTSNSSTKTIQGTGIASISYTEAVMIDDAVCIFDCYIQQIVHKLKQEGYNIEFADVQDAFEEHKAGSENAYIEGIVWGSSENIDISGLNRLYSSASFHPNEKGAKAYASVVQDVIDELIKEKDSENSQSDETDIDLSLVPSDAVYYNGHYYSVFDDDVTWTEAEALCESLGGYLATITSEEEQEFITEFSSGQNLWIGGYREDDETVWMWVTGEIWSYTNWDSGEPNNSSNVVSNENRVVLWNDGYWNDLNDENTTESSGYICEWGGYTTSDESSADDETTENDNSSSYVYDPLSILTKNYDSDELLELYNQALKRLEGYDSFTLDMNMEIDMNLVNSTSSENAVVNYVVTCIIQNYGTDDLLATGSGTITGGGLNYAYDMRYENGMVYYDYSKPVVTSASLEMEFDLIPSGIANAESISDSSCKSENGSTVIVFVIDGNNRLSDVEDLMGSYIDFSAYEDISLDEIKMTVILDLSSGNLESIEMEYEMDMTYSGYDVTAECSAVYEFTYPN